jgi:hypothetical protein
MEGIVPVNRRLLQEPYGVTSQKTVFFKSTKTLMDSSKVVKSRNNVDETNQIAASSQECRLNS